MEYTKFTPGPWVYTKVDYAPSYSYPRGYIRADRGPFDALWSESENVPVVVCQDASSYTAAFDFPREVDASLIAAAPDLYAACKIAERWTLEYPWVFEADADEGLDILEVSISIKEMQSMLTALAKARGENQ